ncbi:pseudoazurin [Allorhizobium undicola]|uniref:pseudoazurin n=1 Tax=Allorhizobium undicola TaxID=78527 RepID=UPI000487D2CA|nr:pseudoazurin [Allorhizobium undicola]
MKALKSTLAALALIALPALAIGADHEIRMMNFGKDGGMVFEPPFVKAEVGDTVTFIPANSSHNVRSYALPAEVAAWNTPMDQKTTITLEKPGVYLYYCPPHLMMGMVGVIQAGAPVNLDEVRQKAEKLRPKLVMKADRLERYLGQVSP